MVASTLADGSLLPAILRAKEQSAHQLSGEQLSTAAERLAALAQSLGRPLLLPVSRNAERLVGAALLIGGSDLAAASGGTHLAGMRVLLVDAVVVQMGAIASTAFAATRAGARVIGAAVLDQLGSGSSLKLDVYALMTDRTMDDGA
jgi:hypothetical protein